MHMLGRREWGSHPSGTKRTRWAIRKPHLRAQKDRLNFQFCTQCSERWVPEGSPAEVYVCGGREGHQHHVLCQLGQSLGMYLSTVPGSYANSIVAGMVCGVTVNVPPCLSQLAPVMVPCRARRNDDDLTAVWRGGCFIKQLRFQGSLWGGRDTAELCSLQEA